MSGRSYPHALFMSGDSEREGEGFSSEVMSERTLDSSLYSSKLPVGSAVFSLTL